MIRETIVHAPQKLVPQACWMSRQQFDHTLTSEGAHDGMSQKLPVMNVVRLVPMKIATHAHGPIHN